MPMKLFVICVGDLATVGGSVLVVTPVQLLYDSFSFCLQGLGTRKFFFTLVTHLCCGRVEFLRGCDVSRVPRVGHSLSRHILGGSVSALMDYGLWLTVYCLF